MQNLITKLGRIYNDSPCQLNTLSAEQVSEIRQIITDKFLDLPINVSFEYGNTELDSFSYVKKRYYDDNVLLISADNNNSALLPNSLNLWLRAWHDYIHIKNNYLFGFEGEFYAFLKHIEGQNETFKQVFFSEIVLQTAFYETYGMFAVEQKVILLDNIDALIVEVMTAIKSQIRTGAMNSKSKGFV